jgi:ABC-type transporter Mla maintaining outer membrane lipid asymmetry ATPase subunit MlaF
VGQRILMLHEKRIYAAGTAEEIFNSTDRVVRQFINGESDPKEVYF